MRLLIREDQERVVEPVTPQVLRELFHPAELWYGTEFDLHSPGGQVLGCAAAWGPFMAPEDEGEMYLSWQDSAGVRTLRSPLTRAATLALFLRFMDGDTGFLDELPWEASRGDTYGAGTEGLT